MSIPVLVSPGHIAPASKTYVRAAELAALDHATTTEVDYIAARDTGRPAATRAVGRSARTP